MIERGASVVVASSQTGSNYHQLATQLDIQLDSHAEHLVDHFHQPRPGSIEAVVSAASEFGLSARSKVEFSGVGHRLNRSPLATSVLGPKSTAYDPANLDTPSSSLSLVSAVQSRRNARLIWSGSSSLLDDDQSIDTLAFVRQLVRWTLHQTGHVRIKSVSHVGTADGRTRSLYKVKDEIVSRTTIARAPPETLADSSSRLVSCAALLARARAVRRSGLG